VITCHLFDKTHDISKKEKVFYNLYCEKNCILKMYEMYVYNINFTPEKNEFLVGLRKIYNSVKNLDIFDILMIFLPPIKEIIIISGLKFMLQYV